MASRRTRRSIRPSHAHPHAVGHSRRGESLRQDAFGVCSSTTAHSRSCTSRTSRTSSIGGYGSSGGPTGQAVRYAARSRTEITRRGRVPLARSMRWRAGGIGRPWPRCAVAFALDAAVSADTYEAPARDETRKLHRFAGARSLHRHDHGGSPTASPGPGLRCRENLVQAAAAPSFTVTV